MGTYGKVFWFCLLTAPLPWFGGPGNPEASEFNDFADRSLKPSNPQMVKHYEDHAGTSRITGGSALKGSQAYPIGFLGGSCVCIFFFGNTAGQPFCRIRGMGPIQGVCHQTYNDDIAFWKLVGCSPSLPATPSTAQVWPSCGQGSQPAPQEESKKCSSLPASSCGCKGYKAG